MKIFAVPAMVLFGPVLSCLADGSGGTAESLAAAEKAFAHESIEKGTRTAFLDVLAEDGIVFEPGPQNGRKLWQTKPESKGLLSWEPVLAATATMGDLGYTTGPWSSRNAPGEKPERFGQFVSIWRWEKGKWKLILDLDERTPMQEGPTPELQIVENHAPHEPPADALAVMLTRDRDYVADPGGKLEECAEDNARFYRAEKLPVIGKPAAAEILPKKGLGPIQFGQPKTGISEGGDLGYLWGEYTLGDGPSPSGYYLRIWRRNRSGEWNLALDLLRPR